MSETRTERFSYKLFGVRCHFSSSFGCFLPQQFRELLPTSCSMFEYLLDPAVDDVPAGPLVPAAPVDPPPAAKGAMAAQFVSASVVASAASDSPTFNGHIV